MKVKPPSLLAVEAARRILADADVRHPRDIHVEAIAARNGAMVLYGLLTTARGHIVRAGKNAVIRVDARAEDTPSARFTIAHELGHHVLHDVVDHFIQCSGEETRAGRAWQVEREASHFAAELLVPAALGTPYCAAPYPTWEDVHRLRRVFKIPIDMSVIRFVELAVAPCAAVLVNGDTIEWAAEAPGFAGKIVKRRKVHAASVASAVVGSAKGEGVPREVPGEAWGGKTAFVEHAVRIGATRVLSWIVPA